jgi:hypothetical protein
VGKILAAAIGLRYGHDEHRHAKTDAGRFPKCHNAGTLYGPGYFCDFGTAMTINARQFSNQVVIPTLQMLDQRAGIPYTDIAYYLVMGTIANESLLGTWLVQEGGPALGLGQIQPASLTSLLARLTQREATALATITTPATPEHNVVANLPYSVALVRLFYWHNAPAPLPTQATIAAIYDYYKQYYNTPAGAATLAGFTQNWALTGISLPAS